MDKKEKQIVHRKAITIVSLLLSIAAVASTAAYFLYRLYSEQAYNEKWKDYDNCGLG